MANEIKLNLFDSSSGEQSAFIGWSPVRLIVSGQNVQGKPNAVKLTSKSLTKERTQLVFKKDANDEPSDELVLQLGEECRAECLVAGKFQPGRQQNGASAETKDVAINAAWNNNKNKIKGSLDVMIRVRRNVEALTDKAREDFINAIAELNGYGQGIYVTDFIAMHVEGASESQHRDTHFLPWHRLYLLDVERLLQRINPKVTLPYWRFDEPAPKLFSENFLGATEQIPADSEFTRGTSGGKLAKFASTNSLSNWKIGNTAGIERVAFFDTKTEPAGGLPAGKDRPTDFPLINQVDTLALGGSDSELGFASLGRGFAQMESTPHGAAHVSFNGYVNNVPVAPQDPLFFLLHCNVDRLWALWQFLFRRDTPDEAETYPYQNRREIAFNNSTHLIGLFPDDYKTVDSLQWPWDDTWSKPYNLRPPGTRSRNFTASRTGKSITARMPSISDSLDAFGYHASSNYLGFSYDDVPFDHGRFNE